MDTSSVLIVLTGSMGDVVRALPLASVIGRRHPKPRMTWLVDERWKALVECHPAVDRVIVFPARRTLRSMTALFSALRAERYDVALDLQRILKSGICGLVSRAPRRIGFDRADTKEFNHFFTTEQIRAAAPHEAKLDLYLAFAEALALPVPAAFDFGLERLASPERLPLELRNQSGAMLGVVMGSSWPSKDWTVDGYVDLGRRATRDTACRLVLLGGADHRHVADRVAAGLQADRVVNLAGRTDLPELAATLAVCRAAVGPDTGAGHLAAAVGTPYVGLFGPTDPRVVAPYRCEALAVTASVDCSPCRRRRCRKWGSGCMGTISGEAVWRQVSRVIRSSVP
jgi:lipopolysaccharide heptosyltransferase I